MAMFKWEGVSETGQVQKGTLEAPNEAALVALLRKRRIRPRQISKKALAGVGQKASGRGFSLKFLQGVSGKELSIFSRQFATMIDAGLPLVQCLDILGSQQRNKYFANVVMQVKSDVESGSTFADALKKHPNVFDDLYVNLVAAGEVGGIMDTIFLRLSAYLEKTIKLRGQVKSAMVYPVMIMVVAIAVITVLLVWVIPVFEKMFKEFGKGNALPAPTQLVIAISHWLSGNIIFIAIGVALLIALWKYIRKTPRGREVTDDFFLKLPLFGSLIRKVGVSRFTRTLGTMVTSGVPILEALDITARTAGNKTIEKAIMQARKSISEGKTITEPLLQSGVFPSMVCQMINVGEQTGAMDTMLNKIADFYDDEVDAAVKALTSMIEPLMMVGLGGIIGGLVVSMYLPIFSMAGAITGG